jgi:hypothetical protein
MRNREQAEIEIRIHQAPGLFGSDVNPQFLEQSKDGASLHRPWRIVIAGDEHERSSGESFAKPLQLTECKYDG